MLSIKIIWRVLELLHVHLNFITILSISLRKLEIFDSYYIESIDIWRESYKLTLLSF